MAGPGEKDQYWRRGHLHRVDEIPWGDDAIAGALDTYASYVDGNQQSLHWQRAVKAVENFLFVAGRHYVDDMLFTRLTRSTEDDLSINVLRDIANAIPRPVNDLLGRYVDTNISLLTENKPMPRVTPKSDAIGDKDKAELSELTIQYLWEALNLPEKHREIARLCLLSGACWLELCYDPTVPRRLSVPVMRDQVSQAVPTIPGAPPVDTPLNKKVPVRDEAGRPVKTGEVEYGDIQARIVSLFEMHVPPIHWWNDEEHMGWVMREFYMSRDELIDKYTAGGRKMGLTKKKGWFLENLEKVGNADITDLPVWWWERLSQLVEGGGPTLYVGNPELWKDHTVVRVFDRAPSAKWPKGRTVIIAGGKLIYDSPPNVGARAYDPRWPKRWHPYIRFRWEALAGNIYGRSLISKLLPKIKRVNAIDSSLIMWRRTVPIAAWLMPKGAHPVEDFFKGGSAGNILEWDPRLTNNQAPQPVFPPPFPEGIWKEREIQIAEMEAIAGTEEILRGQRPSGVNSAAMINVLRKQALASRSPILQAWDESLQEEAGALLQETIRHIGEDSRYLDRLRILAQEQSSNLAIDSFVGSDLSDNVIVKIDTMSEALLSREAKESKATDFLQYAPGLVQLPQGIQDQVLRDLGYDLNYAPKGPDVERAMRMVSMLKEGQFQYIIPRAEDDPYIFYEVFVEEYKRPHFEQLSDDQQILLLKLIDVYKQQVEIREQQRMEMQMQMMELEARLKGGGGG